ncbi:MAG: hypothetical protein WEE89_19275 [Gemmatimonadota bacterium]
MRWYYVGSFCALIAAGPLSAQEQRQIPEELVAVLLGGRGAGSANITVGQLPPDFPADLKLPANARVVGGMSAGRFTHSAIIALPGNTASARTAIQSALSASGWTIRPVEQTPSRGFQSGGFQNPREFAIAPQVYCTSAGQLMLSTWARNTEQTYVRLDYSPRTPERGNVCERSPMRDSFESIPLPLLRHPEGARQGSSGSGGSSDSRQADAEIEAAENAKELIDHYTPQLREAGWTQVSRADVANASMATFTLKKDGRDWQGVLLAVQFPGSLFRNVSVRVSAAR